MTISVEHLTPPAIVSELDKYIVGQDAAKRAVAIALRNRWRRMHIDNPLRDEIIPKNILMIGPTGVGKTEIARRLAKLSGAPFLKVEATKFTEIGYVGRDVESIIRDLLDVAIIIKRNQMREEVRVKAEVAAISKIVAAIINTLDDSEVFSESDIEKRFKDGEFNETEIEIELSASQTSGPINSFDMGGAAGGVQFGVMNVSDMLKNLNSKSTKMKRMKVEQAFKMLVDEESDKLIDEDRVIKESIENTESAGIVFLDEIDKIAARTEVRGEVNREGVQRDLLPLIEGTVVSTKYGPVKTDYILFIASGAFHLAKTTDLLPELQGRLPVRVELQSLTSKDYFKILKEPEYNLLRQYKALLQTDGVKLSFKDSGIREIAEMTAKINLEVDDIGARRLHTLLENLLDDVNYDAAKYANQEVVVDKEYVISKLDKTMKKMDLSKFIL